MKFEYETDRLLLKLPEPSLASARQALDFYNKNRSLFERYEAARPADFYTLHYQKSILEHEYNLALQKLSFRFWVYEKQNPFLTIGTICFYNIMQSVYERCETGYKFDPAFWHKGYAREAMAFGISLMFDDLNLHRIEAYVMEENISSIRLLLALDFHSEGIRRKAIRVRGRWEDHMRFARIK